MSFTMKIIFLVICICLLIWGGSSQLFNLKISKEQRAILSENIFEKKIITEEMLETLPLPVRNWLLSAGIVGKENINAVYLKQSGFMRLKPEQEKWIKAEAEQTFTVTKPSFIWKVKTSMMGIPVVGRDLFRDGKGSMQIKLGGAFSVVNISNDPKINESALQRYLGEILWFPTAFLNPYIKWEPVDDFQARATMSYGGTKGTATFYFKENGEPIKFKALRYRDIKDEEPTEWVADIKDTAVINGIRIPTKLEASWILDGKSFTWYRFEISDLEYDLPKQ